jgi:hypothetical protein
MAVPAEPNCTQRQGMILHEPAPASRSLAVVEWLVFASLLALFLFRGFVPAWRTMNTDFPNYYLAAAIHRQGIPLDRAYEWRWFQRHKDHEQIDQSLVGFAPHPPMVALPLLPLAALPSLEAKRVWLILNLAFLALALWILSRVTQLSWRRLLLLTFLCILPLRENFLFGQYYVVILLLLCAAYYAACRGWRFTSGAVLAAAASLKIFPVFFLILFLRKRNWRAAAGILTTGVVLAAVSLFVFGWNVHKIYLLEVLPRALHGDLVGPYVLQWNSFTALCRRFFLAEPELNPAPLLNSPAAYAIVQAVIATALLFSFLLSTGDDETPETRAWEWSTFLSLLILLSSMPTAYHHCILILALALAVDFLLKRGKWPTALLAAIFYILACYPLPAFAWLTLQARLAGDALFFLLLLLNAPARATGRARIFGFALAAIFVAFLTFSNLRALRNRDEDFSRRLPPITSGYGTFSITRAGDRLLADEMIPDALAMITLPGGAIVHMPAPGDVLSIAATPQSPFVYFELTNQRSQIFRLPVAQLDHPDAFPENLGEGRDPAISPDGRYVAYFRDEGATTSIWLSKDAAPATHVPTPPNLGDLLEMSVTNDGDLILAAGNAADPHLVLLKPRSAEVNPFPEIPGATRYPAISPDGNSLAFSRRESGAWHLYVRELATGAEQKLTSAACNATAPAWEDSHTLLYLSDCGRGLALSAAARVTLP